MARLQSLLVGIFIYASLSLAYPKPVSLGDTLGPNLIKNGYVAFGDSYAAGIGTGTTDGDGCRKGSYSYPKQLAQLSAEGIDFQNLPCSGAIVREVLQGNNKGQIDKWENPGNADFATLSIGGNDIGFYPILTACVLRVGQAFSGDCDKAIQAAYDKINGRDLINDISSAMQQIIEKSGRPDFKLYLTGYPTFFNQDTSTCAYSTFFYWQPGHHAFHRIGNWAYLEIPLRVKINKLVTALNTLLQNAADSTNRARGSNPIRFIDPNPYFNGHRFCEVDNGKEVVEPDSSRKDTWLFLSGWPDNDLPGTSSSTESANQAQSDEQNAKPISALTAYSCNSSNDWYNQMACDAYKALNQVPTDPYDGPSEAGNVTASDVSSVIPTRSAKTFHPRTLGHRAYVDAIRNAWIEDSAQIVTSAAPKPASPAGASNYQAGTCNFHLKETVTCQANSENLFATIKLLDNGKNQIGATSNNGVGKGPGINVAAPLSLTSKLPLTLLVTGQHAGDYVQFAYGAVTWKSTNTNGPAQCSQGSWDPKSDQCSNGEGPDRTRDMDCSFPC
jgi:lysophospholipase L1-like esterase